MRRPSDDARHEPRLIPTLREDVGRVIGDVRKRGFRRAVSGTLGDLERFYLSDSARQRLSTLSPPARMLHRLGWLIRGLLMKLTPPRRVLLAVAFLFLAFGDQRFSVGDTHVIFQFRFFGVVFLILGLMLELKDKLVARDELQAGRTVQLALMPQQNPAVRGWDVWMYTEPANDVGGDLIDHLPIDDTRHAVVLGDVAGKALPAALLMVKLQATLRALIPQFAALSDLGAGVNRILVRDGLPSRFATLIYLVLTADSGVVRVLNAGHPPPLIIGGRTIEELPRGSIALGILADAVFAEERVDLASGDVLVAYSDGVTEAANAADEFFGDERLREAVARRAGQPAAAIGESILAALAEFVGDAPQHDDVSLVIVRRAP